MSVCVRASVVCKIEREVVGEEKEREKERERDDQKKRVVTEK